MNPDANIGRSDVELREMSTCDSTEVDADAVIIEEEEKAIPVGRNFQFLHKTGDLHTCMALLTVVCSYSFTIECDWLVSQ